MTAASRFISMGTQWLDRLIALIEDVLRGVPSLSALKTRDVTNLSASDAEKGLTRGADRVVVALGAADIFTAEIRIATTDLLEARAAATMQLDRHAPIDVDKLEWTIAPGDTPFSWHMMFARTQRLDALCKAVSETGAHVSHFVAGEGNADAPKLRTSVQFKEHRSRVLTLAASFLAVGLAATFLAGSLESRQAERLDAAHAQQSALMARAETARTALDALTDIAAVRPAAADWPQLAEIMAAVAASQPDAWDLQSLDLAAERLTLVYLAQDADRALETQFLNALRETLGLGEAALSRQPHRSDATQITLTALIAEASP